MDDPYIASSYINGRYFEVKFNSGIFTLLFAGKENLGMHFECRLTWQKHNWVNEEKGN